MRNCYNKQRVRDVDFKNSRDLFLHGMVGGASGGTCVSMPVLYVAVGPVVRRSAVPGPPRNAAVASLGPRPPRPPEYKEIGK